MVSKELVETIHRIAVEDEPKLETEEGLLASGKDQDFGCIFGRDAALRSIDRLIKYQAGAVGLEDLIKPKSSLITLAQNQGKIIDDWRDEQPGKISHELRYDREPKNQERLAELKPGGWPVEGEKGHNKIRSYGSVDATPLFIVAACKYLKATADFEFFKFLNPHLRGTNLWMEKYGDSDGDLFLEFAAKNRNALLNQSWKDSNDSIQTADGQRPKEPIALVEVQGYQYWALIEAANLYRQLGDVEYAKSLYQRAGALKTRFNQEFWMPEEKFFAYVLDGKKRQIKDITSNVGHLLITGIIAEEKVPKIINRLMQPDIFTPYGIRTLSIDSAYYSEQSPAAYHNGSIWPHDNGMIYLGLKKLGYTQEAERVKEVVLEAEWILFKERGLRNPELYLVTSKGELTPYPTAAHPQGWVVDANKYVFT